MLSLRIEWAIFILVVLLGAGSSLTAQSRDDDYFDIVSFASQGRSVAAELAELNGDGRVDLFVVALVGMPPEEKRIVRVYLQGRDGSLPTEPSHTLTLPRWSAVYDVADLREEFPGEELVLMRPDRVTLLSLADARGRSWDISVPGPTTAGLADDERGLEPFRIVYGDFGREPWLLVPQLGELTALTADGVVRARFAVPRRANYIIIPPVGLLALESDLQIRLDVPKLSLGDVNGDDRTDVIFSTRHEIRVFLRAEDGGFSFEADRVLPLRLVTPRDHIRASGGVMTDIKDIDGDGRVDLLISHVQGSVSDSTTTMYVYLNRDGEWKLDQPTQVLISQGRYAFNALYDLNADGRVELVRVGLKFSRLEILELLLSQELDVEISVHRFDEAKGFEEDPWKRRKIELPFSFETGRFRGFIPTADVDLNGDGYLDFVNSGDGLALEIHLGGDEGPFGRRSARQKMSTAGVIHFGDLDANGLMDFVIFDPHNFDVPVRVGRNLGRLPGSAAPEPVVVGQDNSVP